MYRQSQNSQSIKPGRPYHQNLSKSSQLSSSSLSFSDLPASSSDGADDADGGRGDRRGGGVGGGFGFSFGFGVAPTDAASPLFLAFLASISKRRPSIISLSLSDGSVTFAAVPARSMTAVGKLLVLVLAAPLEAGVTAAVPLLEVMLRVVGLVGLETELEEDLCAVDDDELDCCASRFSRKSRRPSSAILFLSS